MANASTSKDCFPEQPPSSETSQEQGAPNQNQIAEIQKIGIKVPPFWHDCPEIWFTQIEAQFVVGKITSDNSRYNTVVASIECKVLCQVSEAVLNPPAAGKYENLKQLIISRYSDSAQSKIQKLLSEMSLGDQKPSQLLAEMRRLGGNTVSDDFMKTLWLNILPQQVRAILSTNDGELSRLAVLADTILEVSQCSSVQSVGRTYSPATHESSLEKQIAQLTRAVERLTASSRQDNSASSPKNRSRSRSAQPKASNNRSTTPSNNDKQHEFCWYHYKFGNAATKCKEPCNYKPSKN